MLDSQRKIICILWYLIIGHFTIYIHQIFQCDIYFIFFKIEFILSYISFIILLFIISCTSKVMLKILQARLQQYVNHELSGVQAGFRKGRGTRDQIANIQWIMEKGKEFQETSTSASLTMLKPLTVLITTNWKILRGEIPDHLTCLLRNLYAGQVAIVRIGHGSDWFQIGKGVCQGCILSPCLFNFCAEYIM